MVIDDAFQVRIVRAMLGMGVGKFAQTMGVCAASVTGWEHGRSFPQRANRQRFNELCREQGIAFLRSGMPVPASDKELPLFDKVV